MDPKKAFLMSLLDSDDDGTIRGRTRLQKLAFLAQKEFPEPMEEGYSFKPYEYGPFSANILHDLDDLQDEDLVIETKQPLPGGERYDYELTDEGKEELREYLSDLNEEEWEDIRERAELVVNIFNDVSMKRLLEYVYSNYEEYTTKSVL
jgi:uncharacterized protein YwgA